MQSWCTLRFDDHRGLDTSQVSLVDGGLESVLTRGKTMGPDKGGALRALILSGRTITVVLDSERAVKNLKRLVAAKTGIPTESQQVTFGGKVITDKVQMKEYNI